MRFRRGWQISMQSWRLVASDRRLLVFPLVQAVLITAAMAAIFAIREGFGSRLGYLVGSLALAYPLTFASTFLGVAFVALGRRRLDGEDATIADGFACARSRLRSIALWALLAAGVGVLIQALGNVKGGWVVGRIIAAVGGLAWSAATFFVVPVIALEHPGPIATLKRSAGLVRQRWGEGVVAVGVGGGVMLVGMIPLLVLIVVGSALLDSTPALGLALLLAAVVGLALLFALTMAFGQLFNLALYRYATAGEVTGGYSRADLDAGFRERVGRRLFRR